MFFAIASLYLDALGEFRILAYRVAARYPTYVCVFIPAPSTPVKAKQAVVTAPKLPKHRIVASC
jgi:hypothetical protein